MKPVEVKAESERIILALGGRICDWLPHLDRTEPRASSEVAERALVLHAMLQIYFGAPADVIAAWIRANQLESSLSRHERALLTNESLTKQERIDLYWYIEALWAMAWAGQLTEDLAIDQPVGGILASLLPNLQVNEDGSGFRRRFSLRPFEEIYRMLDLHYRAHWYARDGQLNNYSTEPFNLDVIMERRRTLEWISDRKLADWEDTPEST
ncbi:MAG TPA: DUF4272 domain-containing protein [Pyrinomonadaceae bacterium]